MFCKIKVTILLLILLFKSSFGIAQNDWFNQEIINIPKPWEYKGNISKVIESYYSSQKGFEKSLDSIIRDHNVFYLKERKEYKFDHLNQQFEFVFFSNNEVFKTVAIQLSKDKKSFLEELSSIKIGEQFVKESMTYQYDLQGNLTQKVRKNEFGEILFMQNNEYDNHNKLLVERITTSFGRITKTYHYPVNCQEYEVKIELSKESPIVNVMQKDTIYQWLDEAQSCEYNYKDSSVTFIFQKYDKTIQKCFTSLIRKYDKSGKLLSKSSWDKSGNKISETLFQYDKDLNKVIEYQSDNELNIISKIIYYYNEQGQIIKIDNNNKKILNFEYDVSQNLILIKHDNSENTQFIFFDIEYK